VKPTPEIDSWLASTKPPATGAIRRVREIILRADRRMTEYIKYGTLNFGYVSDFAVFVQRDKKNVRLMFHRGARIPGWFAHLEGTHPSARFMSFADLDEVEARAAELTRIVAAWCALVEPADTSKPAARPKPARRASTKR
jgi:hypothetical protein